MPVFTVEARDPSGKVVTQVKQGASRADIVAELRRTGYTVLDIRSDIGGESMNRKQGADAKKGAAGITPQGFFSRQQLPVGVLAQFCRQLSVMLKAGVSLIDSLESIREEQDNEYFRNILARVIVDVESGARLAEAMAKHTGAFTRLFVSMVEAGETSGSLEQILEQMAQFFRRRYTLQKTIKGATAYPKFVGGFFALMLLGIFGFLVPQFQELFAGRELPFITRLLIFCSDAIKHYWFITGAVFIGIGAAIIAWKRTPDGARKFDEIMLKVPLFGSLINKANTSRFAMTLAVLVRNGVTLDQALEITAKTMNNLVLEQAILRIRTSVIEGNSLFKAVTDAGVFPPLMAKMVKVGEESGALPDMLAEVTSYYEDEVDSAVKQISALMEPALIVILGAVVAVVVVGIYLPIFNLADAQSEGAK